MSKNKKNRAQKINAGAGASVAAYSQAPKNIKARHDAAGNGRRLSGWTPASSGPNTAIQGLQRIRDRARDVGRNDWSGEASVQKWTTNLIGIGITPRFKRVQNKARKQYVVDLWNDFVSDADADNVLDLYGLQTLAVRSWLESGEVFIRRRRRFVDSVHPVPLQIQLLEADMVPLIDEDQRTGMPAGNIIRSGIELNKRGQRVAYWFYKDHPGDGATFSNGMELIRVLASDVLHIFEPKRPGQLRGVSMLAAVMVRLKNIGDYEDATLERQKLANLFVGFLSRSLPQLDDEDRDPLTGSAVSADDQTPAPALPGLRPGLLAELGDGEEIKWSNPPEAGTNYDAYMRTNHLGTAAGSGLPYELFSGDIANISDRTLRIIINEFRRHAEQRQWQIIIPQMCQPVMNWFVQASVLAGLISMDEAEDVRRVEHAPHGWSHIHPVQDPAGKKIEVDNGFRSRASVIGGRGDDPDDVDDEIAADDLRQQKLKIGPYSAANATGQP